MEGRQFFPQHEDPVVGPPSVLSLLHRSQSGSPSLNQGPALPLPTPERLPLALKQNPSSLRSVWSGCHQPCRPKPLPVATVLKALRSHPALPNPGLCFACLLHQVTLEMFLLPRDLLSKIIPRAARLPPSAAAPHICA